MAFRKLFGRDKEPEKPKGIASNVDDLPRTNIFHFDVKIILINSLNFDTILYDVSRKSHDCIVLFISKLHTFARFVFFENKLNGVKDQYECCFKSFYISILSNAFVKFFHHWFY